MTSHSPKLFVQSSAFRSAYSPPVKVAISFNGPGRTRQEFKDECDINRILANYAVTGVLPVPANARPPIWGDIDELDFQAAMDIVAESKTQFEALPAKVRARFDNDPGKLLEFVQNPFNRAEAHSLGLLRADYQPTPSDASAADLEAPSPIPSNSSQPPNAKP